MTARAGRLTGVTFLSYTGAMTIAGSTGRGVMRRERRWRILRWGAAALLLSLPWFMMQVSDEWNWRPGSFAVLGAMLAGALGAYELAVRTTGSAAYRAGVAIAVAAAFVLVWMNLAAGVIGSEDNPANLMYGGVLAVGAFGAIIARGRPSGMARALVATAIAQVLLAAIAPSVWEAEPPGWAPILALNAVFAALFLAAAWLFQRAARDQSLAGAGP